MGDFNRMSKINRYNPQAIVELTNNKYAWSMENDNLDELVWADGTETDKPTHDEILAKAKIIEADTPMRFLRYERDARLKETDWMASSDRVMTDAWKTYRQELRDLPANTSDPANPTWPTKPS
nr:phage tail fiber assembly protein [uncultured Mediterranean phage uvMED]